MKVSYLALQNYFSEPLPAPDELVDLLTFHTFEVEGTEEVLGDTIIDIDVLANRSSDCLSHRGIAKELATLLSRELKGDPLRSIDWSEYKESEALRVSVEEKESCDRYIAGVVRGVSVGPSPEWLREYLERLGQRSINNVVDATNYTMLEVGQPLHAFDAGKLAERDGVKYIVVRAAREKEKITTLTGEQYTLTPSNLLITDGVSETPIGIAGVKGGKLAEVDSETVDIVLESAHFNYVSVRKTSQALKLQTDASVRFQNDPSPELAMVGMREVLALITDIAGGSIEGVNEYYAKRDAQKPIALSVEEVGSVLGAEVSAEEIEEVLTRLGFTYTKEGERFSVTPPFERTDIALPVDLIEEIGRVRGYSTLPSLPLPQSTTAPKVDKVHYYTDLIRRTLSENGFSEVLTYTLTAKGEIALKNALASDKNHLRSNLLDGVLGAAEKNMQHLPLLGKDAVNIFEIGTVFLERGEELHLALCVATQGKKREEKAKSSITEALARLQEVLGVAISYTIEGIAVEIALDPILEKLPEPQQYEAPKEEPKIEYTPVSSYPFMLRDVALWAPSEVAREEIEALIKASGGEHLSRIDFFDMYEKDGRTSYAFHLVFQSSDRTLTDKEATTYMEAIYNALLERGFEIR